MKLGVVVSMTGPGAEQAVARAHTANRIEIRYVTVTKYRIASVGSTDFGYDVPQQGTEELAMDLGSFSVSLAVKDIKASRDFYAKLGFEEAGGNIEENWLILRNRDHVIGLFQGMFERNLMTFNPGWDQQCAHLDAFTDIRELQKELRSQGIELLSETDESAEGPGSFMIADPDGNPILVDQHR